MVTHDDHFFTGFGARHIRTQVRFGFKKSDGLHGGHLWVG
jgi:hypothetical protein